MLREVYVMDYSLLMIIIQLPNDATSTEYCNIVNLLGDCRYRYRTFISNEKNYVYILGIIDYLQKFNVKKFFENKYLSILYGDEIKYVSAVEPIIYSERMFDFSREYIFISKN